MISFTCAFVFLLAFVATGTVYCRLIAPLIGDLSSGVKGLILRKTYAGGNEQELFVWVGKVAVHKLSLVHGELKTVSVMTIADDRRLVKLIADTDESRLADCDIVHNVRLIGDFKHDLLSKIDKIDKLSKPSNVTIEKAEISLSSSPSSFAIGQNENKNNKWNSAESIKEMLDVDGAEQKCQNLQNSARILNAMEKNSPTGNSAIIDDLSIIDNRQQNTNENGETAKKRSKRSYLIFPGTNWCGKGNTANHVSHFGESSEEDKCCKTHDLCPYSIAGFSSRYNLFNYRLHTLSHCDCDKL